MNIIKPYQLPKDLQYNYPNEQIGFLYPELKLLAPDISGWRNIDWEYNNIETANKTVHNTSTVIPNNVYFANLIVQNEVDNVIPEIESAKQSIPNKTELISLSRILQAQHIGTAHQNGNTFYKVTFAPLHEVRLTPYMPIWFQKVQEQYRDSQKLR